MKVIIYCIFNQVFLTTSGLLKMSLGDVVIFSSFFISLLKFVQQGSFKLYSLDKKYTCSLFLLMIVFLLSSKDAVYFFPLFRKFIQAFLYTLCLYFIVAVYVKNHEREENMKRWLVQVAVVVSLIGVLQELSLVLVHFDPLAFFKKFTLF